MREKLNKFVLLSCLLCWGGLANAAEGMNETIAELQHGWVKAFYKAPENEKETEFVALESKAHQLASAYPGHAEPLIWEGIILSSHAKFQGMFSAGKSAKTARDLLLEAEKIDANALNGSALTSLGSLYYKVPRVVSFGDYDKARDYLERALKVNPTGIDPNFFYGEFLMERGEKAKAIEHLKRAQSAPARPNREDADAARQVEIKQLLDKLTK